MISCWPKDISKVGPAPGLSCRSCPPGGRSGPANEKTKASIAPGAEADVFLSQRGQALANLPVTRSRHPGVAGEPDASGAPLPFAPGRARTGSLSPATNSPGSPRRFIESYSFLPPAWGIPRPRGVRELREAIAAHVRIDRGVRCEADQIVVVHGSQAGLDLCARMLLDPGDTAFVEDPGYLGARAAFTAAGARIVGIPVTPANGLALDELTAKMRARRRKQKRTLSETRGATTRTGESGGRSLLYVTPSHQFPLGMTMSLGRRLELLEFAPRKSSVDSGKTTMTANIATTAGPSPPCRVSTRRGIRSSTWVLSAKSWLRGSAWVISYYRAGWSTRSLPLGRWWIVSRRPSRS